ncbi:hypothetical protein GT347_24100 [Xylophilus rhododendri]|uniref:Uncharacterized protein n=1 Tax=Xylophilus rhododendri TaxID=2697032 RepID=A0A857J9Y0_9BURK|nr:hypothetical protein [Xylophilus rhododendri]QHJ00795.1 hypothetical protein GT347_24100 [Xylophilus rhododendri]
MHIFGQLGEADRRNAGHGCRALRTIRLDDIRQTLRHPERHIARLLQDGELESLLADLVDLHADALRGGDTAAAASWAGQARQLLAGIAERQGDKLAWCARRARITLRFGPFGASFHQRLVHQALERPRKILMPAAQRLELMVDCVGFYERRPGHGALLILDAVAEDLLMLEDYARLSDADLRRIQACSLGLLRHYMHASTLSQRWRPQPSRMQKLLDMAIAATPAKDCDRVLLELMRPYPLGMLVAPPRPGAAARHDATGDIHDSFALEAITEMLDRKSIACRLEVMERLCLLCRQSEGFPRCFREGSNAMRHLKAIVWHMHGDIRPAGLDCLQALREEIGRSPPPQDRVLR